MQSVIFYFDPSKGKVIEISFCSENRQPGYSARVTQILCNDYGAAVYLTYRNAASDWKYLCSTFIYMDKKLYLLDKKEGCKRDSENERLLNNDMGIVRRTCDGFETV